MTDIAKVHPSLEGFCGSNPGVAIGAEIFEHLVKKAIALANQHTNIEYPTTNEFEQMPISFSGSIDPSKLTVLLGKEGGSSPGEHPLPLISLRNAVFTVAVRLQGVLMSEHSIQYYEIVGGIAITKTTIALNGKRSNGKWIGHSEPWRKMSKLPNGAEFTQSLKDDWELQERAIMMIAKDTLGAMLLESVEIPNMLAMLGAIQFIGPVRAGGEDDVIMFSGPAEWVLGCPRDPTSGSIKSTATQYPNGTTGAVIDPNDPNASYPKTGEISHIKNGDVFVHLPRTFVETRFDGVAKPAAGFVDEGGIGPIRWHYEAAIAVRGLTLSMVKLWPLEFKLEIPAKAFGSAGAGVKIGCVYVEAAGAAFDGEIDPLEFYFRIGLDAGKAEVFFESRFGNVAAHDFQFHHWPPVDFPLDQIIDFVLAKVTEYLISSEANRILNVTRFSLINFQIIRGFGKMLPEMAAEKSPGDEAVTVGFSFQK